MRRVPHLKLRHAVGIGLVGAAAGVAAWFMASASGAAIPVPIGFEASHQPPVAGHVFAGLAILDTGTDPLTSVSCGSAVVGRHHLAALRQHAFFEGASKNIVVCSWRVPNDAAGKRLRVSGTTVTAANVHGTGPTISWLVKR